MRLDQVSPAQAAAAAAGREEEFTASAADEIAWYDIVGKLRSSVEKFRSNFTGLLAQRDFVNRHPTLHSEYAGLVGRGSDLNSRINEAQAVINKVTGWFQTIKASIPFLSGGMGQMGVIQLLPIAVIAGAVALITKWLADVYVFAKKVEEIKRLESKGLSPQRAADLLETSMPSGFLDVLKGNIIWLVIGGVLLLFGPEIVKIIQRGR